jgi:hypothetical protein
MPVRSLSQSSFFDPAFVCPTLLKPGTVAYLLAHHRAEVFPAWLLAGWRGEQRLGRNAWPAEVLATLWVLRWSGEGMSRLASIRRARTDLEWRAAMGLACDIEPPHERTMRDFEKFLADHQPEFGVRRGTLIHEQIVKLCINAEVLGESPLWGLDSTYSLCYGAVKDTFRLLGDGIRQLGLKWARATRTTLEAVAEKWNMPMLLAKSAKGSFDVDWRDSASRLAATDTLARGALAIVKHVRESIANSRRGLRKSLLRSCRNLLRVVRDDLETNDDGQLVVARGVASGRLISLTDPQAQHGRKSKSKKFNGFKIHVLGDLESSLIAAVTVTHGGMHDQGPTHRLVRRAKALIGEIKSVLADGAYGGAAVRSVVQRQLDVTILAPPSAVAKPRPGEITKASFAINFDAQTATCPGGETTTEFYQAKDTRHGLPTIRFKWPQDACDHCPLREDCLGKGRRSRSVKLSAFEEDLREHRAMWDEPAMKELYRRRAEFERIVNRATRHGARQTRTWGLQAANLQAHAIAACCNLKLLAKALSEP